MANEQLTPDTIRHKLITCCDEEEK